MRINRRLVLGGAGLAASSALAAPAIAQSTRTLTMVTAWGRGTPGLHDAAARAADMITEMSGGSLTVDLKAAGELVAAQDVFDTVTSGQVDMYHAPDAWFVSRHPAYAFFTTVPFGMTGSEMATWYYHGGGRELHDRLGEIFNIKSFLAGNTGAQSGGWYRKKINEVADFEGLKVRIPGLGGSVLKRLGAEIVSLPGTEVYEALASGSIDATEWVGPWADELAGFDRLVPFYYPAGFHEPCAGLTLAVNRDVFLSLSEAHQRIVETAASEAHQWALTLFLAYNGQALERLQASGVEVRQFPEEVWTALGEAAVETMEDHSEDPIYRDTLESYQRSMRVTSNLLLQSEGPYRVQRDRVFG